MPAYTNVHRAFLQVMISRGTLSLPQAMDILREVTLEHGNKKGAQAMNRDVLLEQIEVINGKLAKVEQRLELVEMEIDIPYKEFIVFANSTRNDALKFQGLYNEQECNFFKLVIDGIMCAPDYSLPAMQVLNLCTRVPGVTAYKKVTKQRAQELIYNWVNSGYLLDLDDQIYFGPRTIGEFKDYFLLKHQSRFPLCGLCLQPTFKGLPCPNDDCTITLHQSCAQKYFVKNKKCPLCKVVWPA